MKKIILITLFSLVSTMCAYAENWLAIDICFSYDGGDTFSTPKDCEIGMVFENGEIYIDCDNPKLFRPLTNPQTVTNGVQWKAVEAGDGSTYYIQVQDRDYIQGYDAIDLYISDGTGFIVSYTAVNV